MRKNRAKYILCIFFLIGSCVPATGQEKRRPLRIGPIDIVPSFFFDSTSLSGGDEIVLEAAYGLNLAAIESARVLGDNSIENGPNINDLIKRVQINRVIENKLFLELDYDSERDDFDFSGLEGNLYSVRYQGSQFDLLRGAALGNRYLSIPDSRYLPIQAVPQLSTRKPLPHAPWRRSSVT